jgi:redox-sensitive bicupin YhaK (pirin superfamily)
MVGPWCFLDRYGPVGFTADKPMDVGSHPHMGLQTVSWLTEGEIVHNDSLGSEAVMRAGQLNLMTSGHGIAHSEETPKRNSGRLSGVQLWVALPDEQRNIPASFDHYASVPELNFSSGNVILIAGQMGAGRSPAKTFSPIVAADIALHDVETVALPLEPAFEHAIFVLSGDAALDGQPLAGETLHYLAPGRDELHLKGNPARLLLIGGEPFRETILMWWNFVARTAEEIDEARRDWAARRRFGEVTNYRGARIDAPPQPISTSLRSL